MERLLPPAIHTGTRASLLQVLLAYFAIYIVWGSTFLAIRVGVAVLPPLLYAGLRFLAAGIILYLWVARTGFPKLSKPVWQNAVFLGFLMFCVCYSCLFWAEQYVPSGLAAVVLSTIPIWTLLFEVFVYRTEKFSARVAGGTLAGFLGVAVLALPGSHVSGASIGLFALLILSFEGACWGLGTVLSRRMELPESKLVSATIQMGSGGVMLLIASGLTGEFSRFHLSAITPGVWFALLYLILGGSIIGFTAYIWLLGHQPVQRVASYAYVNPVIAVAIGYFLGGEKLNAHILFGTALILAGVLAVALPRKKEADSTSRCALAAAADELAG
jgi:drug/metabolite transporter (DMT)-like permease